MILGHKIMGRICPVTGHAQKFKVGDLASVGCMAESCQHYS